MQELDFITIGNNIQHRRNALGITQEQIADKLDVNPSHISNIECGRSHPSLTALIAIANCLECSVDIFISNEYSFNPTEIESPIDKRLQKTCGKELILIRLKRKLNIISGRIVCKAIESGESIRRRKMKAVVYGLPSAFIILIINRKFHCQAQRITRSLHPSRR